MKDQFEALRKALEAGPTPGPWTCFDPELPCASFGVDGGNGDAVVVYGESDQHGGIRAAADAAYIAACDPATIQALLDDRDSWEKQASDRADDAARFAQERDALRAALGLGENEVLVALKRPDRYEDTHPEMVAEDAIKETWPEYRTVWPKSP